MLRGKNGIKLREMDRRITPRKGKSAIRSFPNTEWKLHKPNLEVEHKWINEGDRGAYLFYNFRIKIEKEFYQIFRSLRKLYRRE